MLQSQLLRLWQMSFHRGTTLGICGAPHRPDTDSGSGFLVRPSACSVSGKKWSAGKAEMKPMLIPYEELVSGSKTVRVGRLPAAQTQQQARSLSGIFLWISVARAAKNPSACKVVGWDFCRWIAHVSAVRSHLVSPRGCTFSKMVQPGAECLCTASPCLTAASCSDHKHF